MADDDDVIAAIEAGFQSEDAGREAIQELVDRMRAFLIERGEQLRAVPPKEMRPEEVLIEMRLVGFVDRLRCAQRSGEPPSVHRMWAVERLWVNGDWHGAWIDLVNEFFPGEGPTAADVPRLNALREQEVARSVSYHLAFMGEVARLQQILVDHGYVPQPVDSLAVAHIISIRRDLDLPAMQGMDPVSVKSRAREAISSATDPGHAAWTVVLQDLFS